MAQVIITKDSGPGGGYDISVYQDGGKVKTAWALNLQQAYGKADILSEHYRGFHGESAAIVVNVNNHSQGGYYETRDPQV